MAFGYETGTMKNHCLHILSTVALMGPAFGAKVIPNNAAANLVLGQTDFVSAIAPATPSSFSLDSPTAIVIDPVTGKVFVADKDNRRVLRYPNVASLGNGAGAEAVFGQARFSTRASVTDPGFSGELRGMFFDRRGRLWVADAQFNRVVMFEAASFRETNAYPDRVYGQPDFATTTSSVTASKMYYPEGVWVDTEDRLWVSEYGNNRVLRFDAISTKGNGAAADGVLGQNNFTTAIAGTGSSGIGGPVGITVTASGTLFVGTDSRVLRFDHAALLGNGAGASGVLCQPDFATTTHGLSATQADFPWGTWITPDDTLWVLDYSNHRALRFDNASTKANGSAANAVVGQPDFITKTTGTTSQKLNLFNWGLHPFVDGSGNLWIPDANNNRVLTFPPDITKPLLALTGSVPKTTTKKNVTIKGTASDTYGVSKVQYQVNGGPLKIATGTSNWQFKTPLKLGKNTIKVFAVDSVGNQSLAKTLKINRS